VQPVVTEPVGETPRVLAPIGGIAISLLLASVLLGWGDGPVAHGLGYVCATWLIGVLGVIHRSKVVALRKDGATIRTQAIDRLIFGAVAVGLLIGFFHLVALFSVRVVAS